MTVKLSKPKIRKVLQYYFTGVPQTTIAKRVKVDQSTVSLYGSRFSNRATEIGLFDAGKEFGVLDEVNELRSLSVELLKMDCTAEDAREGVKIIDTFSNLGVEPGQYKRLIQVCQQVDDPHFIEAALKLKRIESESQLSYEVIVSRFDEINVELPVLEQKLVKVRTDLRSATNSLAGCS